MSAADVIVVGLGAAGSATLHQLARRGATVMGIDRFSPPHDQGSSHGETRVTRQAIGEGDDYVPLALASQRLWREMEAETGETLMLTTGALMIGAMERPVAYPGKPDFIRRTVEAARRFAIPHELIDPAEARRRYPPLAIGDHETVYFEPGAGVLFPERCVAAQLTLARRYGARIVTGERVIEIHADRHGARVITDAGTHEAGLVVVAAGAWTPELLGGELAARLSAYRQTMHWFAPHDAAAFAPERFPVFMWMHGGGAEDWFYGFPLLPGDTGVKVAAERFETALATPDDIERRVDPEEPAAMFACHAAGRLGGLTAACVRSATCLYTMAPESRFVIGADPGRERTFVVSACSGHGFKHSPAIGEAMASLVLEGALPAALAPFDPARLSARPAGPAAS